MPWLPNSPNLWRLGAKIVSRPMPAERTNLAAYTEPTPVGGYPGYVSLNREADGSITLTVRSPGHGGSQVANVTLPYDALRALAAGCLSVIG